MGPIANARRAPRAGARGVFPNFSGVCDDCVRDPLRRVNYFPGQVLGVDDLTAEQRYHRDQVSVALRTTHGGGVVCGLEVTPAAGGLQIAPGLAIDPCGQEIIVPATTAMKDPRQPIDDQGAPSGPAVAADVITLSLVYAERADGSNTPGASRTLETYPDRRSSRGRVTRSTGRRPHRR